MNNASEKLGSVQNRGFPFKCDCGLDIKMFTSKTQENPGRPFFRCISCKEDHLFKWVEDAVCEEFADALPKIQLLETEICQTKAEVEELKGLIKELKEVVVINKNEASKWKVLTTLFAVFVCLISVAVVYLLLGVEDNKNIHVIN